MPRRHGINTTIENQLVLINSASSVPVHAKELHPGFWKQLQLFCSEFMRNFCWTYRHEIVVFTSSRINKIKKCIRKVPPSYYIVFIKSI